MFKRKKKTGKSSEDTRLSKMTTSNIQIAQSVDINDLMDSAMNDVKTQIDNYAEVCDMLSMGAVNPHAFIDKIYLLIKSLNFEVVGLWLADSYMIKDNYKVVARGFKNKIPDAVISEWKNCSSKDGYSISWEKLMKVSQNSGSAISELIRNENLDRVGYSPIEDGNRVFGFLFIGSLEKQQPSTLSSSLIELCSGRIGLVLSFDMERKNLEELKSSHIRQLKNQLLQLNEKLAFLQENNELAPEQLNRIQSESLELINSSLSLLP